MADPRPTPTPLAPPNARVTGGDQLEKLSESVAAASLRAELVAFREGVEGILHGDAGAADKLVMRGYRIVDLLKAR